MDRRWMNRFYDPEGAGGGDAGAGEGSTSGGGGGEGATPTPPATPAGPTPAELQARLDALALQNRQLAETNERLQQHLLYTELQRRAAPAAAPPATDAPPDREQDPEAYIAWAVKNGVEREVSQRLRPVVERAGADRAILLSTAEEAARSAVRNKYPDLWATHEVELTKFLSAYPPEQRTTSANIEEALFRVVGRATVTTTAERSRVDSAASLGGRASAPSTEPPKAPDIDPEFKAAAARSGMSDKMFAALQGRFVTVDEYVAAKAAEGKR